MATNFVSPGAYAREIDESLYVSSLAETAVALIGTAPWGPVNTPTTITNHAQLFGEFGRLSGLSKGSPGVANKTPLHPMMYAANRYLTRGRNLRINRVESSTSPANTATYRLLDANSNIALKAKAKWPGTYGNNIRVEIADANTYNDGSSDWSKRNDYRKINVIIYNPVTRKTTVAEAFPKLTGDFGNDEGWYYDGVVNGASSNFPGSAFLRIEDTPVSAATAGSGLLSDTGVVSNAPNTAPAGMAAASVNTGSLIADTKYYVAYSYYDAAGETLASSASSVTLTQTAVTNTQTATTSNNALTDLGITILNTLPVTPGTVTLTASGKATVTDNGNGTFTASGATGGSGTINYTTGAIAYTWNNNLSAGDVSVAWSAGGNALSFRPGTVDTPVNSQGVLYYIGTDTAAMKFAGGKALAANTAPSGVTITVGTHGADLMPANSTSGAPFALSGGTDGTSVTDGDINGARASGTQKATGISAFEADGETFSLIASPGVSSQSVVNKLISVCENRGDCFAIVDPPYGLDVDNVVNYHNGDPLVGGVTIDYGTTTSDTHPTISFDSSYGAMYWPWGKIQDDENNVKLWVPPSVFALQVYAYNDYIADPWFAPAGPSRGVINNILDLEADPSQGDRDVIYSGGNAINPIVAFQSQGAQIFGQRTLQREQTALDRVNVRRMMIYLRRRIRDAAEALLFQPNDFVLWRRFVSTVTPILSQVKAGRGIRDFRVQMDASTNTDQVIENNQAVAKIFIKPTKTAEIIVVDFIITAQGATFSETVVAA